jgi:glucose-6-phosphate dehydrogenase assembly protein OpcA
MPDAMTDSFLEGQGIPVDLPEIETTLTQLWGPAAEQVGGPEREQPTVTRIALANLVVESLAGDCPQLRGVLETVVTRYPCRAIVFRCSDDPGRRITAEVSAVCHLPAPGLPQVCSERIMLRAGPHAIDLIPGALRPLLEAELPLVLWWTGDPRPHEALFRDLGDECSRLILDLPDPGAAPGAIRLGLDPTVCPFSRDTAWFGLTRWRELVAQFFDPPCPLELLGGIETVRIEALSPEPAQPPRLAVWLAAWLAGQLGWKPQGQPVRSTFIAESNVRASFLAASGTVTIEIVTRPVPPGFTPVPRVIALSIAAKGAQGAEAFHLARPAPDSPAIRVESATSDVCRLPRLVEAPELDPAHRIAAALESSRTDPPFQNALPIALWLLEPAS